MSTPCSAFSLLAAAPVWHVPLVRCLFTKRGPHLAEPHALADSTLEAIVLGVASMNPLRTMLLTLFLLFSAKNAQTPVSHGKPTKKVLIKYGRLVEKGAVLSREGWEQAGEIYKQTSPFRPDGDISLMRRFRVSWRELDA